MISEVTHPTSTSAHSSIRLPVVLSLPFLSILLYLSTEYNPIYVLTALTFIVLCTCFAWQILKKNPCVMLYSLFIVGNLFLKLLLEVKKIENQIAIAILSLGIYFLVVLYWLVVRLIKRSIEKPNFLFDGYSIILLCFFSWCFFSSWIGGITFGRLPIGIITIIPAMLGGYYLLMASLKDERDISIILFILTLSGVVISLLSFHQFTQSEGLIHASRFLRRIDGYYQNANTLGMVQFLCGISALTIAIAEKTTWKKIGLTAMSLIILISLMLSFSRSAILAYLFSAGFIFFYTNRVLFYYLSTAAITVSSIFIAGYWDVLAFILRVGSAMNLRDYIWASAWNLFLENPILGLGVGNSSRALQPTLPFFFFGKRMQTHNAYLEIMIDTGIIGILLYIAVFLFFFKYTIRVIRDSKHTVRRNLLTGVVGLVFGSMVHKVFEAFGSFGKVGFAEPIFFIIMTLAIWLARRERIVSFLPSDSEN